ncbi:MAG TPA: helix-turn-helix transcriptional regulator [Methyloceanibacter sp.]|nr:helix-turn-helix transcriptional regulator [Methyloceanibacter sp.]
MPRLTHGRVWSALDALARRYGLSSSGLAKRAGLDATAFNKSKRVTGEGRLRWPTTESIAKVLEATGATVEDFTALVITEPRGRRGTAQPIPLIGLTQAGAGGFFDDGGFPVGVGWDQIRFPRVDDDNAYALEVTGDSMQPLYRDGDILIVSPNAAPRKGDRVVLRTTDGEVMAKILVRRTAKTVELASFNPAHANLVFPMNRIDWMARIVWASQ